MNLDSTEVDNTSKKTQYLRVILMGIAAFIVNTTEFVPVGLLSSIAQNFSITPAHAGWMLTVYAWIVALMSLPLMLLTGKMDRKTLLLASFVLFFISHILSVFAWCFEALLISRIGIAFAHAIFWSITASIAIRVAPWGKKNFALSVLATGTGLAMVLGVPLGRLIGESLGWRMTFATIAVASFVMLIALFRLLPSLPSLFSGSLSKVSELMKKPILLHMYFFIFLMFTAHYTAYSYIEPFLKVIGHNSAGFTTLILLLFGGAGIIGSVVFGYLGERANKQLLIGSTLIVTSSTALLYFAAQYSSYMIALIILWGAAMMTIGLAMQVRVFNVDANASDIIMSLFSGIINLGIGAGALFGNQVIQRINLQSVGVAGAIFGVVGLVVLFFLLRRVAREERVEINSHIVN
ncbi:Sugar efflux transporter [Marinomonas spartinae]|uniref:Sugar efflux transporter n=1 Tax=Marinomonas spartinae TaxID=1792290 RepID=A0A1A8TRY3_9GAMM|nr:sugar transporter [Marinomonas spartinae]SBS29587.1 Sugar efflux transporter [Marinomonas spartinae]SBS36930.1 Sugar efflux transporter [Marinomonas spartinae]